MTISRDVIQRLLNVVNDTRRRLNTVESREYVLLTAFQTLTNKTLTTPTIGNFSNATHDHEDAAGGGQLSLTAAVSGILPPANGGTGVDNATRTLTINTNSGTLAFGAASKTLTINENLNLSGASGQTLTLTNSLTVQGGGNTVLSSAGNYTLTIPATGTAALLGTANTFTAAQTVDVDSNNFFNLLTLRNDDTGVDSAVALSISNSDGPFQFGRLGPNTTGWSGYGSPSEAFFYSGLATTGLNFITAGTNAPIRFYSGRNALGDAVMVLNNLNVGIGTTSPSELLELNKSTSYQLRLTNLGTGGGYWNIGQTSTGFAAGGGKLLFVPDSTSSTAATVAFTNTGNVGIGEISPTAQLQVEQNSASGAKPVLRLRQADLSEEFIRFDATVGTGNPINTSALGSYYGRVRVWVEGVGAKWLALYD